MTFNVTSTIAGWILGLALGGPAAIILFFQLPMMASGDEQAKTNVAIAAVLLVLGLILLTARRRVTLDTTAKTVSWSRHLFGLTWRRSTLAAQQYVAVAAVRDSGHVHTRTVWLIDRAGKRALLKGPATIHDQTQLERCAHAMGWSVESDR